MPKRKKNNYREKPRMCDPGMCGHCIYIGEGDLICDNGPGEPVLVVDNWEPTENYLLCKGDSHGKK